MNNKFKRIFLVVLDSVGVGEARDAKDFGDEDTNTVKHIIERTNVDLPNLNSLGLSNLVFHKEDSIKGYCTRAIEVSKGKDTLTGHLEMMGVITKVPFQTFIDNGFPSQLINLLEEKTGRKIIGNKSANGVSIINELGEEHMKSGAIIVYTSADSVLQIAAHEDIVPLDELYNICKIARDITSKDPWKIGRIIARPFIGNKEVGFKRTSNRHDYALNPAYETVLDKLKTNRYDVISIGKISDIYNNCGITKFTKTKSNIDGIEVIKKTIKEDFRGLCFANLNDFDMLYGHRRDVEGYSSCLKEFDDNLPDILSYLKYDDLIIFTADHGNDPTYKGSDHTRENIPVLIYSKKFMNNGHIPSLNTFADIGATLANNFGVDQVNGTSFLGKLK